LKNARCGNPTYTQALSQGNSLSLLID
jgi:hypothetical protein